MRFASCIFPDSRSFIENLINLKELLRKLGFIYGKISVKDGRLSISGLGNIRLFAEKSELRLKKEKIFSLLQNKPRYHYLSQ